MLQYQLRSHLKSWCDLGLHTKIANELTSFPQCCKFILCLAQCKGIQILESRKFTLVESGIREYFAHGIWNPRFWNPEYSSRNLESLNGLESGIRNQPPSLHQAAPTVRKKLRENKHLKLNLKRVTLIPPKNKNYRNKSIMYKSLIYDNDI